MALMGFETARHNMVENQIRCCKILDPVLLDTFETMPREAFLPDDIKSLAYMEGRVPLPCGQEMLSPLQEGYIMQTLDLQGDERVLEIGAGTGFLTALLAMHAKEVVAFELHAPLAKLAGKNLDAHGITNATVTCASVNPVVTLVSMKRTPSGRWQTSELIETLLQNMEGLPEKREFVF